MIASQIYNLIKNGEGLELEFKKSYNALTKDVFDTICSFSNRMGGVILLGVNDNGIITGVLESEVKKISNELMTTINNPTKFNPTIFISPEVLEIDEKIIIYIYVPQSSQVHSVNGKIYDRNLDGDIDITKQQHLVSQLYIRKQQSFFENNIYPALQLSDFRSDLILKVRRMARNLNSVHPWLSLDDMEMFRSAGLYQKDYKTGNEGFTIAATLLLGKDEVIHALIPHYKTDAIFRVNNIDRYDDRLDVRTNLIDAYELLMAFIGKHLPEKFHQQGTQRINVRDLIFREVVANTLVHREFSSPFPAKIIIEKEQVLIENWNKPHLNSSINPNSFSPFPKNPTIAKFFKEIGLVEELGSGVRNTFKFCSIYTKGSVPIFKDEDVFTSLIPVDLSNLLLNKNNQDSNQDGNQDGNQDSNQGSNQVNRTNILWGSILEEIINGTKPTISKKQREKLEPFLNAKNEYILPILDFCYSPKSKREILEFLNVTVQTKNFNTIILPFIELDFLTPTIKDKPTSKYQKYIITSKGKQLLSLLQEKQKS